MFFIKVPATISALLVVMMVVVVNAEPPLSNTYGAPLGPIINNYNGQNAYHDHGNSYEDNQPKSYEFGYAVKDEYTGNDYKRREASDGNQVQGEYRVQLPDGRTQIVTYYADWQTGFHADVRYEGHATYPDQAGFGNYGRHGGAGYAAPSTQYGTPGFGTNDYNTGTAKSSVSIKDFSGPGTPYNVGGGGGGAGAGYNHGGYNNNGFNGGNNYDSYNAGYTNKLRPNSVYGLP